MIATPLRGIGLITLTVHPGAVLRACEQLPGISEVLARIRHGEQSALSEAVIAAALVQVGYLPELGPTLGSGRLDVLVEAEGSPVYVEVISPERADAILEAQVAIQALARS